MEPAPDPATLAEPSSKLILLVDDDEHVRGVLDLMITAEGFKLITATDGREAIGKLADRAPDLIISDLMMQGQGGYEFLRELQAHGHRIPVIIITGSRLDDSTIRLIKQEGNVVDFVKKPIGISGFMVQLHQRLGTRPPQINRNQGINERPRGL